MPASTIIAAPSSLSYSGTADPQVVNVTASDSGAEAVLISSDQSWLLVSTGVIVTPDSFTASIDLTGLADGVYNGNITLQPSCCTFSPSGAIATTVVAFGGSGYIAGEAFTVEPNALSTCPCSVAAGIIDTVDGGGSITSFHLVYGGDCYAVGPVQDTLVSGPGDGTFTINIQSITNGVGGCEAPTIIPVTLLVGALGSVIVTKSTNPAASPQVFAYTPNYAAPFSLLDGGANDSGEMTAGTYAVTETPVVGWTTSVSITYRYGQGGFGGNQLYGGGTVSAASVVAPPVIVGATDAITVAYVNTQLCVIHASVSSLSFTASEGGSNPPPQTVIISNVGGGGAISFIVTASQPWSTVASSGVTDQTLSVGINIAGLTANTYNGAISIASACPGALVVIALSLVIEAFTPCPQPEACPFTLGDAQSALAQRLYDETSQFWPADELTVYIVEALRTWNALTSYWRDDFIFDSQPGTVWYDITNTTVAPNTLRPLTVTDQYLMEVMEYHLLEPLTSTFPLTWTGSAQYDVEDLQRALQRRRDEILSTTGCTITRLTQTAAPGKTALPNQVTEIRRVAFLPEDPATGRPTPLFQDDAWSLQAFRSDFTVEPGAIPDIYTISTDPVRSTGTGPAMTFSASPEPGVVGQYEVLALESGLVFCPALATNVTVPDDWTWVLKFGALADLLSRESNSKDPLRAKYSEMRYRQGLALLTHAPAMLLAARADNLPLQIDAVKALDEYDPTWQAAAGPPTAVLTAGMNLIALSASPGTVSVGYSEGEYSLGGYGGGAASDQVSLTATVVRNAPVPVASGDCIQVTRDDYDVIIDYAQHLASFKMGGAEFVATMPLYERFMQAAALNYSRLGEQGEFQKLLWQRSQVEDALNPRYSDVSPEDTNG